MSVSQHTRDLIYAETAGKCIYCGNDVSREESTLDHIVPKKGRGGKNRDNLICSCQECNRQKGAMTAREFRAMMSKKKQKGYDQRVHDLYHGGFINEIKEELLLGRSITESHRYQIHFKTLFFDIHIRLMIRRRD